MLQAEPRPVPTKRRPSSHFPRADNGVAVVGEEASPMLWVELPSPTLPLAQDSLPGSPRTAPVSRSSGAACSASSEEWEEPGPGSTGDEISERALGTRLVPGAGAILDNQWSFSF